MYRRIPLYIVIAILLISASGWCQLSKEDIDSLRAQGEREGWTFTVSENPATRRPLSELCGLKVPEQLPERPTLEPSLSVSTLSLPSTFDWRKLDGVSPVKNQGACGSCWAFSSVGALEASIRIKDGITVDLSEQYLVSCNQDGYNCVTGGWWAHDYHLHDSIWYHKVDDCGDWGPVLEVNAPYQAADDPCYCPYDHATEYSLQNWGYVEVPWTVASVESMKQAIMQYGPISVAVYVGSSFQSYGGGVFNACSDQEINHAVVLVGWDDNQGENGVWFMKNSWGTGWGEAGYMRIEYGCSRIGYNASYVDYGLPKAVFWADTTFGEVPFDVNFDAFSMAVVDSWEWDFGDGQTASVQTPPTHTYNQRGTYDIGLEFTTGGDTYNLTKPMYIVAHADTMKATEVTAAPGTQVVVSLSSYNSMPVQYFKIPVEFPGDFAITYDSFSTVGCRTEYFEKQEYLHYDWFWGKRVTLKLVSSDNGSLPELPPGEGLIAKLYFTIPPSATEGQSVSIDLDGYDVYFPTFSGTLAEYNNEVISAGITVGGCCAHRGDIDHDGDLDIDDVIAIVDWTFNGAGEPSCDIEAEIDGVDPVNIEDLVYLVNYLFSSGPAPGPCQ